MSSRKEYHCLFCGRHQDQCEQIFVNRDGVICSDCIEVVWREWRRIKAVRQAEIKRGLDLLLTPEEKAAQEIEEAIGRPVTFVKEKDVRGDNR